MFVESKNFTDFKREKQIEDQNSLLDHNYAMTLVMNTSQEELDDFIPSTYEEAGNCKFSAAWLKAIENELNIMKKSVGKGSTEIVIQCY